MRRLPVDMHNARLRIECLPEEWPADLPVRPHRRSEKPDSFITRRRSRSQSQRHFANLHNARRARYDLRDEEQINGNLTRYTGLLTAAFTSDLKATLNSRSIHEYYLHASLGIGWLLVYLVCYRLYFKLITKRIWLTQGMITILPFDVVIRNEVLYKEIAKWRGS